MGLSVFTIRRAKGTRHADDSRNREDRPMVAAGSYVMPDSSETVGTLACEGGESMAPSDKDMDWLYRNEREPVEPTAVLPAAEVERLRRSAQGGGQGYPSQPSQQPRSVPAGKPSPGKPSGPSSPPRTKQRRRRRFPVLRTLGVLLLAWLVFLIGTPVYAWSTGSKVDAFPSGERPAEQPGTTVLLVGSDARDDLTPEERSRLGTGSTEGRRTDTMMLLHTPTTGSPVLLSLPRDSYVPIPGNGRNRLNAAYAFGGAPLLIETIEANTGIRIDGYLEVGFLGIVDVVDAVGGIEVCPAFDIDDRDSHLVLSKGCQTVDGVTALGYVRMRKGDPRGDLGRMERQREVIGAITGEVLSPISVLNPVRYWNLNLAAARSLARGEGTGLGAMTQVGIGFVSVMTGKGLSLTVPVSDANARTDNGQSVMLWDEAASAEVFSAIASGNTTDLERLRR